MEIFNRTASDEENTTTDNFLELYQMRRKWETRYSHIFFNFGCLIKIIVTCIVHFSRMLFRTLETQK